ncbi:MAG TPA: ATP-binding protein [Flavobacterium sp.]|jgi:signal transduction histidine kinase
MKLSTQILLAFAVIIILSVADSYTNFLLSKKVQRNSEFLSKSEAVIRNSNKTHKVIIDMQSSFRGYLLTNDSTFLDAYYKGAKTVPVYLKEQKKLFPNSSVQRSILDSISTMHSNWVQYSGQLINARKTKSQAYQQLFENKLKKHVGKKMNDAIAAKFARFDKIEYATRKHHGAMLSNSINNTHAFSLVFFALTICVGISSTTYIIMLITNRIRTMVSLAEDISKGHFTIVNDTRNDELTGLSKSLNTMSGRLDKNIRELENRNAELNKFAYVVSHDLKAPIRGIHNVITWIEEDLQEELSPQMKKYLMIIPQRTRRMEALINGLLDYARISMKTPPEPIDTNTLVHEIADSLVPRDFIFKIDNLPELYAERIKLEQVFANLISNAVKYSQHGKGHIHITCKEFENYYQFSVKDNGIGIDPGYHKKIFEIFQTLREKNENESTGVGLAIVKKIMDEHQENITVKSQSGKGAEFIFTWKKTTT